jgi:hypothetical protein
MDRHKVAAHRRVVEDRRVTCPVPCVMRVYPTRSGGDVVREWRSSLSARTLPNRVAFSESAVAVPTATSAPSSHLGAPTVKARNPIDEHARDDADPAVDLHARGRVGELALRGTVARAPECSEHELAFLFRERHPVLLEAERNTDAERR